MVGYAYLTYKERSIYDGLVEDGIVDDAAPQVDLVRDPTNAHDENAILVLYKGTKLGYLPKNNNKILARLMDGGVKLQAEVNPDIDDEKVWVSIALAK
ncbi:MAG: HIRAN domain-containing protein [Weissella confusa]